MIASATSQARPLTLPTDGLDLTGKVALVTGANQGIGWAVAQLLAQHGARVAVNYPDDAGRPRDLEKVAGGIAVRGDVASLAEIARMFDEVQSAFGRLDILVNNAGIFPRASVLDLDEATWDRVLDVNLKGSFFCAQAAARLMVAQGSGAIVSITSESAIVPDPRGAHYCASKAGLVAITKSLAKALAPLGIRVNAVAPGMTDTAQPRAGYSESAIARRGRANPSGRIGSADDVARAVLYLVSPLSEYVVGQTLFVTGGDVMVP
jgi:NAD(P)-dependent dehydrogenase (short-subunit alcohol dehydrogenase family)